MLSSLKTSLKLPTFAALVAIGAMALPGTALALPPLAGSSQALSQAAQLPVERAQTFSFSYNSGYHGPRYRVIRPGYRHFYNGYYYRNPYWQPRYYYAPRRYYRTRPSVSLGLSFGGGGYGAPVVRGNRAAHYAWCRDRYRTYDARSDTFIARAGGPRVRCRSPY